MSVKRLLSVAILAVTSVSACIAQAKPSGTTTGSSFTLTVKLAKAVAKVGEPLPMQLAVEMPKHDARWASIVDRHHLDAPPSLAAFVGDSFTYADMLFGYGVDQPGLPVLASTIALRHAGFTECCDTEDMFRRWFRRLQDLRLLPAP